MIQTLQVPPMEVVGGATSDVQDLPHVPCTGQGRFWRSVRLPSSRHWKDVRLQEAREEAHQETQGRGHGPHREEHPPEDQLQVRGVAGVCVRDQGRSMPRADHHERW